MALCNSCTVNSLCISLFEINLLHGIKFVAFGALQYNFNPLEYEFQIMALTPSWKALGVDFMNSTNQLQRFKHVRASNWP